MRTENRTPLSSEEEQRRSSERLTDISLIVSLISFVFSLTVFLMKMRG